MNTDPRDWDAVASAKLVRVLGPIDGPRILAEVRAELRLEKIETLAQFREFADTLLKRSDFASMVGRLLSVHATIHRDL